MAVDPTAQFIANWLVADAGPLAIAMILLWRAYGSLKKEVRLLKAKTDFLVDVVVDHHDEIDRSDVPAAPTSDD